MLTLLFSEFVFFFFFFKQKTAYEMRISDWSSDVCSSDLRVDRECRRCEARLSQPGFLHIHAQQDGAGGTGRTQCARACTPEDQGMRYRACSDVGLRRPVARKLRGDARKKCARQGHYARRPGDRKRTRLNSSH